ncbi:uncharacterized protein ARMOST_22128 [Armillaria ostoyae]|uniref:Uncharacterized protein n=1 Tax=Armillaria ostoyae TaxID=47428 RepID=A0A284SC06_ARMOS|nr:uncharacterized protein ARMOST_22128 [Armillaria ostoyae]
MIKAAIGIGRLHSPGIAQYAAPQVCFLRLDERNGSDQNPWTLPPLTSPLSIVPKGFLRGK